MKKYQDYSVADFDGYDCLKLSKYFYLALLFCLFTYIAGYVYWQLSSRPWLFTQVIITIVLIFMCYSSERFNLNLKEFPQKLPDK